MAKLRTEADIRAKIARMEERLSKSGVSRAAIVDLYVRIETLKWVLGEVESL